jgi:hypothetical protein
MAMFAMAVPILPGKTDQWRRFMDELKGPRMREFSESRRRMGVHERTFLQSTPQGDFVVVTLEGDDPAGAFVRFSQMNDDFSRWFLQQVVEIHGLDLSQAAQAPLPTLMIDSHAGGLSQR